MKKLFSILSAISFMLYALVDFGKNALETYLHIHINFGDEDGNVRGGHLVASRISATCEIILSVIDGRVERKLNEEIGLNLFEF